MGQYGTKQGDRSGKFIEVLGEDQIKTLMAHSGSSRDELIAGLSQQLPELINQLTPNGRLPTEHEAVTPSLIRPSCVRNLHSPFEAFA